MTTGRTVASVVGVHRSERHRFSKTPVEEVVLVAGLGVEGTATPAHACGTARGSAATLTSRTCARCT
jgi:hypothetical protein